MGLSALLLSPAAGLAQSSSTDNDGARMVPLTIATRVTDAQAETLSARHCTVERDICLRARRNRETGPWTLDIQEGEGPSAVTAAPDRSISLPAGQDAESEVYQIWPRIIHEATGAMLVGVERYRRAGFSGGGASETTLLLIRVTGDGEPEQVLSVQNGYTAMVRACFTPQEYRRRGVCHDEYSLTGTLALAPRSFGGRPALSLAVSSRSFPRGARDDSSERARVPPADRIWEADPACSYRRTFAFDAATGRYAPDTPIPECDTYRLP